MTHSVSRSRPSAPLRRVDRERDGDDHLRVSRSQTSDPLQQPLSETVSSKADTANVASGPHEARLNRPPARTTSDTNRATASGYVVASGSRVFGTISPLALSKSMGLTPTDEDGVEAEDAVWRSDVPVGR
jgi:hypothetical protein